MKNDFLIVWYTAYEMKNRQFFNFPVNINLPFVKSPN